MTEDNSIKIQEESQDAMDKALNSFYQKVEKQKQYLKKGKGLKKKSIKNGQYIDTRDSEESIEKKKQMKGNIVEGKPSRKDAPWNKKIDFYLNKSKRLLDISLEDEIDRLAMYEKKN